MIRILVVDDEELICNSLSLHLEDSGFKVFKAYSFEEAVKTLGEELIDIMITDLRLGDNDGIELVKKAIETDKDIVSIIMTAYGTFEKAFEAGKLGVFYFITKPFSMEQVNTVINKVVNDITIKEENTQLKKIVRDKYEFSNIIGKSPQMKKVFETIEKVCGLDVTVLITGESGTGKEIVANAIHFNSRRKDRPFVKVNCSALPEALLESELFGVEKGAYTGADRSRKGRFEMAESGSILLDEIGDMELNLQAKLLRVLQNKTIEPLGSTKSIDIDTRVIASTNQDLSVLIKEGKFREDLYFRLNVVNIKLPALREKKEDIIPLSEHFLVKYNKDFGKSVKGFAKEVVEKFQNYNWPGNVRELENAVQHSVIFCENEEISLKDLPDTMFSGNSTIISGTRSLEEIEKQHILNILSEYGHNISKASNILGIDRKTLYNKMKKYGLSERQRQ